jgi:hypothetical protein
MNMGVEPDVLEHPPQDHRYVHPEELKKMGAYNVIMDRPNTTILDYAMMSKSFLKSTSSWSERHIVAFRCLILENLPISRILPASDLPPDDDETMKLVIKYLSDSEDDVRSGRSLASLGPATGFYQQLQVVLPRPGTPSDAMPIPSSSSGSGLDEDKLESCANQAVVSFLSLLCMFEQIAQPSSQRRLSFRLSGFSNHR